MNRPLLLLLLASALHTLSAQQPASLVIDLDAERGVTTEEGDRVSLWQKQASRFAANDFVKRETGRKEPGSGRPTLRKSVPELNGHNALVFLEQELVCLDEDAFDSLTQGDGCTWIAVLAVHQQRVGLKDVNAFFGNLKNGGNYEGLWGCVNDDNTLWWGARNGLTFGRFDANNPKLTGPKLDPGRFYLVAGRLAAGTEKARLELFVSPPQDHAGKTSRLEASPWNGELAPVAVADFPVNPKSNPSKMVVGQERDAINHPGHESFDGEIARLLIFNRPLSVPELNLQIRSLSELYGL